MCPSPCVPLHYHNNNLNYWSMKTGKLRRTTGFWKSLFFVGNQCKMRKALMDFLHEEGLKCELEDGVVFFDFNENHYYAEFNLLDDYAECVISYDCSDENYEALEMLDKTFIADKVNTDKLNHCIVLAFNDNLKVQTSFYFMNKRMLLDLFSLHFEELTDSVELAVEIACDKMEQHKTYRSRRIGFNVEPCDVAPKEADRIQALKG